MEDSSHLRIVAIRHRRNRQLSAAGLIWFAVAAIAGILYWMAGGFEGTKGGTYLIPWILMTGAVVLTPSAYLLYKGKFDLFHPLVFAVWSYIFPAFVIGGVIISLDMANPFIMMHVEDPRYNLPYSLVLVCVGFIGMMVGYGLPIGGYLARKIDSILPDWQWPPTRLWLPGLLLMFIGIGVNVIGLIQGVLGFQKVSEVGIYDSMLYFLLTVLTVGYVMLWLGIFYTREKRAVYWVVLAALIAFTPLRMALQGSRSGLIVSVLPIMMAYLYSGRKLTLKSSVVLGSAATLALIIGVIYGNSFRNIKGSETRVEAGEYASLVGATIDYLTSEDPSTLISSSAMALSERVENLSSLAVVVSNYERLAPFEAGYGLENNIINDATTSFVPRFFWPEKPNTSDARAYSDLYFDFGENSFAISPFGDLIRNFGPYGVPLGMILVGLYLRIIYSTLIDTPTTSIWKKVAYFPLLTVVSYESFYATIFPSFIRTLAVLAVSLMLVTLLLKRIRHTE